MDRGETYLITCSFNNLGSGLFSTASHCLLRLGDSVICFCHCKIIFDMSVVNILGGHLHRMMTTSTLFEEVEHHFGPEPLSGSKLKMFV